MVLAVTYFVVWRYAGRETLYTFGEEHAASLHYDDLVRELPPLASVSLYQGERRRSISQGSCGECPHVDKCADEGRCARLDVVG